MDYRREVDGLRALAVVPVVLFHAGLPGFSGGFVGVDVFFVISGYLITSIILAELAEGRFSILRFYERRARRILPALFLVMLVCLPFAWSWLLPRDMAGFSSSLAAVTVFGSNILFWRESGYFDTAGDLKPLLHTWSLAVEEQYYMIFPALLLVMWRIRRGLIAPLMVLVFIASLALAEAGASRGSWAAFYLLPTRGWELLMGAFVAFNSQRRQPWDPGSRARELGGMAGLLLIAAAVFLFDRKTPFPGLYALVPTVGAAMIILFASGHTLVGRFLGSRLLVGVGLISYSAYLWHQPLFAFARHRSLGEPGHALMLGLAVVSFGLAWLSWRFVEAPFRDKRRFSQRQVFSFAIAGGSLFLAVGLAGQSTNGFEALKFSPEQRQLMASATPSPLRAECHTERLEQRAPRDACEYHAGALRAAVFGDSHTVELAYALADELRPVGTKIRHFSFSGCAPMFGRQVEGELAECAQWTRLAVEEIVRDPAIELVVVSYRIHSALFGGHEGKYPHLPDAVGEAERGKRWRAYVDVLQYLVDRGKKVVLVLQAPELPRPMEYLAFVTSAPLGPVRGASEAWWRERTAFVTARLGEIPKDVLVVDPSRIFCRAGECLAAEGGTAYYFDDDHMSVAGARLVVRELLTRLGQW
jgi:peptidoglycan/LPS O-acetylase OafA/YrhL